MINDKATSYSEVNRVVTSIAQGISEIFDENLVGIYLFGSLSYGDFNEESSDIDLVTVIKLPASSVEIEKLEILHKRIENEYLKWAKRVESSYTPLHMLSSIVPPGARPYYGEGIFYDQAEYGNEWIINQYLLYKHGITISGPNYSELVQPVDIQDVRKACVKDLFREWEPKLRETKWLDNPHYQTYLVLNLCRILNTVTNASVLSKKKSADWVKREYPEWKELVQSAEDWHYGLEMNQKDKSLEFLKFVIDKINYLHTD